MCVYVCVCLSLRVPMSGMILSDRTILSRGNHQGNDFDMVRRDCFAMYLEEVPIQTCIIFQSFIISLVFGKRINTVISILLFSIFHPSFD